MVSSTPSGAIFIVDYRDFSMSGFVTSLVSFGHFCTRIEFLFVCFDRREIARCDQQRQGSIII